MKSFLQIFLIGGLLAMTNACGGAEPKSDKEKYSYAIGNQVGKSIKRDGIELDVKAFTQAMVDVLDSKKVLMSDDDMRKALTRMSEMVMEKQKAMGEKNLKSGDEFLSKNKIKEGVKTSPTGLQYKVLREGNGPKPKATDTVKVHYSGKLIDGTEFDSSYKRNQPAEFPVNMVIPGWTEGLQLMTVGSKFEFVIPSALGYGETPNQVIPANSVLIFEVELLGIK